MSKGGSKKCLAYVAAFLIFQAAIILILALTILKIKSPKIRLNAIAVESFSSGSSNNNATPSINMMLLTQLTIKNNNFGHFKYNNATLVVLYNGVQLGEALIPRGRVGARKTKRLINMSVDLSTDRVSASGNSNLVNDINSGILTLSSQAKVDGKVHLVKVIKKNKSGNMNCDWNVNLATRQVENLRCN